MDASSIREITSESWDVIPRSITGGESTYYPSVLIDSLGLDGLIDLMERVSTQYLDPTVSRFLDLGSGDGAVVFLAVAYGFDSYGIEKNPELVRASKRYHERLGLSERVHIIGGDWRETKPYDALGIDFSDISFFYLYPSYGGLQSAFNMVGSKSKPGTILAVKRSGEDDRANRPDNLVHIETVDCPIVPINLYQKQ